ncbi:MAG: oligosaccharide flippase family protein [Pseudomonadota bacterium]
MKNKLSRAGALALKRLNGPLATLIFGTGLAQVIQFIASPFLTRIFSPLEYGEYAQYVLVITLLTVLCAGKFDLGIFSPKQDKEAWLLVCAASMIGFILSIGILIFGMSFIFIGKYFFFNKNYLLSTILVFSGAASVCFTAWINAFTGWINRKGDFYILSKCRIFYALILVGLQIIFGILKPDVVSLAVGSAIGMGVFALSLIWFSRYSYSKFLFPRFNSVLAVMHRHKDLPKHAIPSDLIGSWLEQFPIFVLSHQFDAHSVGLYSLVNRVLQAPMQLIGASFSEIFRRQASLEYSHNQNCIKIFDSLVFKLTIIALIIAAVILPFAPDLFAIIFGEKWRESGDFARIVIIAFALKFIVQPVSFIFYIAKKTLLNFKIHFCFFIIAGCITVVPKYFNMSVNSALYICIFLYIVFYLTSYLFARKIARGGY